MKRKVVKNEIVTPPLISVITVSYNAVAEINKPAGYSALAHEVARKDKERYCHDGGCVQRSEQTLRNDRKRHIECKQRRQRCRA